MAPAHPARSGARLTRRDRVLLAFAAEQRVFLAGQIEVLLEVSSSAVARRLRALAAAGYLERRSIFHLQPSTYLITARGLSAIGSGLPRPAVDLRAYIHDVGLGWIALAASAGAFGPVSEVVGERRMRSADGLPQRGETLVEATAVKRFGVRLWAIGATTHEQLHYPDLVLRTPDGRRVALELELSAKSSRRLAKIMNGYGLDRSIDAVVYLTNRPSVARRVQEAAARAGVGSKVQVQPLAWTPAMQRIVDWRCGERNAARGRSRVSALRGAER